jgi:MraZ protein
VVKSGLKWAPEFPAFCIYREEEQMFLGQYEHTIDEKGRVTIPARYRELLEDGAYITQGFDLNLIVMTPDTFEQISQKVNQMNTADPLTRQLRRLIFSNADRVEADKLGRILIPSFLRDAVQLLSSAVVVGAGSYFEIWSPDLWKKQSQMLLDAESNQQRFSVLDLTIG